MGPPIPSRVLARFVLECVEHDLPLTKAVPVVVTFTLLYYTIDFPVDVGIVKVNTSQWQQILPGTVESPKR
jgi:hypothetical protein